MKISIITVCYNCKYSIEKTIRSVIDQSYSNIQYIIIDGNSTDGTLDIINKYRDNIDIFISENDNGIYDAFNKGLQFVSGDLVSFLNAGDYYDLDYGAFVIKNFSKEINFLCSNLNVFSYDSLISVLKPSYPSVKIGVPPFLHPSFVVRKEVFTRTGNFNTNFRTFSDFDWMLKVLRLDHNGKYVNVAKVYFELNGVSSKYIINEYISVLRENNFSNLQLYYSVFYYSLYHFKNCFKKFL